MISLLLLLICQDLKVPAEIRGDAGLFVIISAETQGKQVKFYAMDLGLAVLPSELLSSQKSTIVVAVKPGRYRILCYTAIGDIPSEPAICTLVIGGSAPPPGPFMPVPVDPLIDALSGIYGGLQEASKQADALALAGVYRAGAALAETSQTVGTLYAELRAIGAKTLKGDAIRPIRDRIAVETIRVIGDNPAAQISAQLAASAKAHFLRAAHALEVIAQ